jgi:hypothetical protein
MGRQKKRTAKKYNRSKRKNNTVRKKTYKKRVRKTNKKRMRTRKRMRGGSLYDDLQSGKDTRSLTQKATQRARGATQSLGSKVQNLLTPGKVGELPQSVGYLPLPEPISPPEPIPPAAQPVTPQPEQVVEPSSNPSKNKEFLKHAASGLGGATIALNPMAAAGVAAGAAAAAAGALGAYGTYKAGQGAYRVIGSTKDKIKSKVLIENIKQCLKKLVMYAVINNDASDAILAKLRENSGYFDEDGKAKITFKKKTRERQRDARTTTLENNETKKANEQYALNVGGTPVTETVTGPVTGPVTETVTGPVTETVTGPVTETVTETVTEGAGFAPTDWSAPTVWSA